MRKIPTRTVTSLMFTWCVQTRGCIYWKCGYGLQMYFFTKFRVAIRKSTLCDGTFSYSTLELRWLIYCLFIALKNVWLWTPQTRHFRQFCAKKRQQPYFQWRSSQIKGYYIMVPKACSNQLCAVTNNWKEFVEKKSIDVFKVLKMMAKFWSFSFWQFF